MDMINKEPSQTQSNQLVDNFDKGKMFYNRAVDKLIEANDVPSMDKTGLYDKLQVECSELFRQSIPYFNNAIRFIDKLDAEEQGANREKLSYCLNALNTVYIRLGMYDELKPIKVRIEELQ